MTDRVDEGTTRHSAPRPSPRRLVSSACGSSPGPKALICTTSRASNELGSRSDLLGRVRSAQP